jgi:PleD family two-component response regulator
VAVAVPGPDDSLENLLGQADDALYEAKAQGRNRVVLAEPLGG